MSRNYARIAVFVLNCILVFAFINVILSLIEYSMPTSRKSNSRQQQVLKVYDLGSLTYGFERLNKAYPSTEDKDIVRMLLETWNLLLICDEFTLYREQSFNGYFVNVSEAGFRTIQDQGPWPLEEKNYNIFVITDIPLNHKSPKL